MRHATGLRLRLMRRSLIAPTKWTSLGIVLACLAASSAHAQATLPLDFEDHLIVGGFATPTGMAPLPDGRLLVTEQLTARIRLIVNRALAARDPGVTVPGGRKDQ